MQVARAAYLRVHPPPHSESAPAEEAAAGAPESAPVAAPPLSNSERKDDARNTDASSGGGSCAGGGSSAGGSGSCAGGGSCGEAEGAGKAAHARTRSLTAPPYWISSAPTASERRASAAAATEAARQAAASKRRLAEEVIAEALSEIEACEEMSAQLDANRRTAQEQSASNRELRALLGGDEAIRVILAELPLPKPAKPAPAEQSFWRSLFEELTTPNPPSPAEVEAAAEAEAKGEGGQTFWNAAAALLVPSRLLEGIKTTARRRTAVMSQTMRRGASAGSLVR